MKLIRKTGLFVLGTAMLLDGAPIRVMPLGDSITRGYGSGITIENSYRKTLRQLLGNKGHNIDFVGSQTSGNFSDNQHEGRNEWSAGHPTKTNNVLDHIADWMTATPADIILIHLGTNDVIHENEDAAEVSGIIDIIFEENSNATVVLALIINAQTNFSRRAELTTYNSNLNAMAEIRMGGGDDIIVVDMENGAGINYTSPDMGDTYHPSELGYAKMATNWYPAVVQAIAHQQATPGEPASIESITTDGASVQLQLAHLEPGQQISVEQSTALTPPAWTNAGTFTPTTDTTNWSGSLGTNWIQGFYRLVP
jgi:lysophospholipase L1-like esterase